MKLLIAGLGQMGSSLLDLIKDEHFEIYLVDTHQQALSAYENEPRIKIIQDNIINTKQLEYLNLAEFDFYFAITNSDEINMASCKLYKDLGVKRTICRLNNIEMNDITPDFTQKLGVDHFINPNSILADKLHLLSKAPNVIDSHNFCFDQIQILGFRIRSTSRIVGLSFQEIHHELLNSNFQPIIVLKKQQAHYAIDETLIEEGDILYFLTLKDNFPAIRRYLGYKKEKENSIMILGGDYNSVLLAQRLENDHFQVKIIEEDSDHALELAAQLSKTQVYNFDSTDENALLSAGLKDTDYFFALTKEESVNVIASLIAHEHQIEYTFCLSQQSAINSILNELNGVFSCFSLHDDASKLLYQMIHRADFQNYFTILNSSIEILEIKIEKQHHLIVDQLSDLDLPESMQLLLVFDHQKLQFGYENPAIKQGDSLLVLLNHIDRETIIQYLTKEELL